MKVVLFLLCMEVILFCSVWKSYFFALYGSRTFLLSVEVVLFCSVWKSYFFVLYGSRTFLLCMEVVLFCSLWKSYFFCSLWKSYFFVLYGSRTFLLSVEVLFFSSLSCFFPPRLRETKDRLTVKKGRQTERKRVRQTCQVPAIFDRSSLRLKSLKKSPSRERAQLAIFSGDQNLPRQANKVT